MRNCDFCGSLYKPKMLIQKNCSPSQNHECYNVRYRAKCDRAQKKFRAKKKIIKEMQEATIYNSSPACKDLNSLEGR